mmetsp:Transcript_43202/g.69601  ORF Transcript_43202/g.69601 Transcript_43202/m.69601 type:complete len:227 (+) Transcript_43202:585-1265(+)
MEEHKELFFWNATDDDNFDAERAVEAVAVEAAAVYPVAAMNPPPRVSTEWEHVLVVVAHIVDTSAVDSAIVVVVAVLAAAGAPRFNCVRIGGGSRRDGVTRLDLLSCKTVAAAFGLEFRPRNEGLESDARCCGLLAPPSVLRPTLPHILFARLGEESEAVVGVLAVLATVGMTAVPTASSEKLLRCSSPPALKDGRVIEGLETYWSCEGCQVLETVRLLPPMREFL